MTVEVRTGTELAGLLDVPAAAYHADTLTDSPTLSKSIIQLLIEKSPAHARIAHPRLNPNFARDEEDRFDLGTVSHQLFLEGLTAVDVIPFDDWRSKAAKELRELSRSQGRIGMLAKHYEECELMVAALREQCDAHPAGPFFQDGTAERTLVWEDEYGVMCRARLDWLLNDMSAVHDLKTTKASANPEQWSRTLFGIGAHLQVEFYLRGCRAVLGCEPDFRFVVVETTPPYAMSVVALAPDTLTLARKQVDWAVEKWARCLRDDSWPAYEQKVAFATTPQWVENAWLSRELQEVA